MAERLAALKSGSWFDFSMNKNPICPHCGETFDISDNEAWNLYDENDTHDVDCPSCEMSFRVNARADWFFSTDEQEDGE